MTVSKEQALVCDVFHSDTHTQNSGRTCQVWRRNGRTQTWKRDTERFRIPVKHGLKQCDYIDQHTPAHTPEECPRLTPAEREQARKYRLARASFSMFRAKFDNDVTTNTIRFNHATREWEYLDGRPYEQTIDQLRGY